MNVDSDKLGSMAGLTPHGEVDRPRPGSGAGVSFSFLLPAQAPDEIGRLGKYRVLKLLGKGGMAYVFLAEDLTLARRVALKVMKPDLDSDLDAMPRFLREARLMASIKHPHLVTVYDVGQEPTVVWLAMELLEGESLETWLEKPDGGSLADILRIAREITNAIDAIHQKGLLHRDIKPGNIWLESPGARVKLLDFGLARYANDDAKITQSGMVMGTPAFMSPEQARGEKLDARSDLFSLGCTLYCLCTGTKPFQGENTLAVLTSLAMDTPKSVHERNPAVPRQFSDLVMQLLSKNAEQRPASAAALLQQLQQCSFWFDDTANRPMRALPVSGNDPSLQTRMVTPGAQPSGPTRQQPRSERPWLRYAFPLAISALVGIVFGVKLLLNLAFSPATTKPTPPTQIAGKATEPIVPAVAGQVFLRDLKERSASNWPFPAPLPPGVDEDPESRSRARVRVRGKVSPHGIWMHGAPGVGKEGAASITYDLGKQYRTFETAVALNDGPEECSPMSFIIYCDGKEKWRSKPIRGPADPEPCKIDVADVSVLRIELQVDGDARGAHGAWIEPRLLK
jgi:eukaryotic-like serine/threonine-protein kinase